MQNGSVRWIYLHATSDRDLVLFHWRFVSLFERELSSYSALAKPQNAEFQMSVKFQHGCFATRWWRFSQISIRNGVLWERSKIRVERDTWRERECSRPGVMWRGLDVSWRSVAPSLFSACQPMCMSSVWFDCNLSELFFSHDVDRKAKAGLYRTHWLLFHMIWGEVTVTHFLSQILCMCCFVNACKPYRVWCWCACFLFSFLCICWAWLHHESQKWCDNSFTALECIQSLTKFVTR